MKVLIVEDDKILSDTIKQCIESKYNIEQAFDGYEGYIFAKQNIYDVIIKNMIINIILFINIFKNFTFFTSSPSSNSSIPKSSFNLFVFNISITSRSKFFLIYFSSKFFSFIFYTNLTLFLT